MIMFLVLPIVSCALGFFWMLSSLDTSSSQHLRRDDFHANSPSVDAKKQMTLREKDRDHHNPLDAKIKKIAHKPSLESNVKMNDRVTPPAAKADTKNTDGSANTKDVATFKIGTTLWKIFSEDDGSKKSYAGTIHSYDAKERLYTIVYEDG
jgi:hypothetical protein